jgi:ABC-type branched-subunit amino acid transport system permease subunit
MLDTLRHPLVVLAAALAVLPFVMTGVGLTENIATKLAIFAVVGLGFNLLLGYTGLVSFGHSLFFGLGAYGAALSQIHLFPTSFWLPLVFGTAASGLAGIAIGFPHPAPARRLFLAPDARFRGSRLLHRVSLDIVHRGRERLARHRQADDAGHELQ